MIRLLLLLGLAQAASAQTPCVAPAVLVLGAVPLGAPVGDVIDRIGLPDTTAVAFEDDDGGTYVLVVARYALLTVDVVRDRVDRVRTVDAGTAGPFGVRVGMERAEAERRTGATARPGDDGALALWVPRCVDMPSPYGADGGLVVTLGPDGRAASVEIVALRP